MKILGIETSCDETAAAVVTDDRQILSNIVRSQVEEHRVYGGVVPEIASRAHIEFLDGIISEALIQAKTELKDVDGIAVTAGPGLIGGLIVGLMEAKAIASALGKPFIAVNHLEGHALTARLTNDVQFPYLLLLVSGGHCQILEVSGVGQYKLLGQTLDDAVGESFDKVAKMLNLGQPGGPKVEAMAKNGNPHTFELPSPLVGRKGCDFSFSGLKTAVKKVVDEGKHKPEDICATFQHKIREILVRRLRAALELSDIKTIVIAGGVAANLYLREGFEELAKEKGISIVCPPVKLCTDNAAMIAWAGLEKARLGQKDRLNFKPLARWPLAG